MIRVRYDPELPRLSIEGHAGAGPRGQDIICAGVSALVIALQRAVPGIVGDGLAFFAGGEKAAYRVVAGGLGALAERYPEYITMTGGRK